jgi:hypothetical protein
MIMKEVKIITPRVNMNGNSKESLLTELSDAVDAVQNAIHKLSICDYSHGRNYQTRLEPHISERARNEHVARIYKLHEVRVELQAIAEAIYEQ